MSLAAQSELDKLARELQADEAALEPLVAVGAADLRRLRRMVGDAMFEAHRPAYERAAAASALLPAALNARLAQTLIGPYLAARIAAATPPDRAVRMASHLEVAFLADVCLSLDPARVAPTVRGLPDDMVLAVGMELLDRGEHVTLGKFVDVVSPAVLDRMADRITDPTAMLRIAAAVEAEDQVDGLVSRLDDDRLAAMLAAAAASGRLGAAIALTAHLGDANRARLATIVVDRDPELVHEVMRVADEEDAWAEVVPVLAAVDDEPLARLAGRDDLLTPAVVRRMVSAVLPHRSLWTALVELLGRLPAPVQRELAARLEADPDFDTTGLHGLLGLVTGGRDLPLAEALAPDRTGEAG